jgi:DNA-binding NarL/FixJ family response regulator
MTRKIRVAIADDHEKVRAAVKAQLKKFGFDVVIDVSDGKELIEQIENTSSLPDVCVVDVNMPNMDGFETTEAIKSKWGAIKILGFSLEKTNEKKMLQKGADIFLLKTCEPEMLFRTIIELWESQQ